MDWKTLVLKLTQINEKLVEKYQHLDKATYTLARSLKVTEEYGEFADELLSHLQMQRQDKLDTYNKKNLEIEFADSMISLMLLGMTAGIDIEKALEDRVETQYSKWLKP